jgi:hypothetical protein
MVSSAEMALREEKKPKELEAAPRVALLIAFVLLVLTDSKLASTPS